MTIQRIWKYHHTTILLDRYSGSLSAIRNGFGLVYSKPKTESAFKARANSRKIELDKS